MVAALPRLDDTRLAVIGLGYVGLPLAVGFGRSPCLGPVLDAILLVAGAEASVAHGALLLTAYAAGIGLPFLAANQAALDEVAEHERRARLGHEALGFGLQPHGLDA